MHGIDASERMVEKLREKRRTEIPVAIGDFADVGVDGPFALVYVVFSTFFGLLSSRSRSAASTTSPLG